MARNHGGTQAVRPGDLRMADWKAVGQRVQGQVNRDNLSVVSAGVAFYAFFALFPALAAMVAIYGLVADPADVQRLIQQGQGVMPGAVTGILSGQLRQLAGQGGSQLGMGVAIGTLVALWSATKGTKALMAGLNIANREEEKRGIIRMNAEALLLTLGVIVAVLVAIALVVAAPAVLGSLPLPALLRTLIAWLRWPVLGVLMVLGLAVLYRYAPSRRAARWRWLSYGAVLATVLWLIASGLFSWYVANFGSYNETFGSMAAIAILLMWFFLSAYVILLGAELNSEMEHHTERDTTQGPDRPPGRRGAVMADSVADSGHPERS
ncbi:YihY/virulence factor BrkB family protein [Thiohalorhabdus sp. Cl-TMA]|uniref:YihY/virulence factor BrkB family protein n=1 Tax=Thiohalorhabdus methylotrophus TaxID=3242694 RepID=A0ABV4TRR2_9GAMM